MKSIIKISVATLWLLGAPISMAETSLGFGVSNIGDDGLSIMSVAAEASGKLNDNFGWSLTGAVGGSDSQDGISLDLNHYLAAKVRAGMSTEDGFLFVTAGYGSADIDASGFGVSASDSIDGLIYGLGLEAFFDESNWGIGAEFNKGRGDLAGVEQFVITARYRF